VTICRERDEAAEERWFKAAALLMDPKWDEPVVSDQLPGISEIASPAARNDIESRLRMVCGVVAGEGVSSVSG